MRDSSTAETRLSHLLRQATWEVHGETERSLDLPRSVRNGADYCNLLGRFYRLYAPLERMLARFPEWPEIGIAVPEPVHSERLACDLRALGVQPETLPWAAGDSLPCLPGFAHGLGAMYVLEGSTLGSQVILRLLSEEIGPAMNGAETFLRGHGPSTRGGWARFCAAIDGYGERVPGKLHDVAEGAHSTFAAVGRWMAAGLRNETGYNMQIGARPRTQSGAESPAPRGVCPWGRSDIAV